METLIDTLFYLGLVGLLLSIAGLVMLHVFSFNFTELRNNRSVTIGLIMAGVFSVISLVVSEFLRDDVVYNVRGVVHNPSPDGMHDAKRRCSKQKLQTVRITEADVRAGVSVNELVLMVYHGEDSICHRSHVELEIKVGTIEDFHNRKKSFKYSKFLRKL